jgi:hypothetical protein
VQHESDACLLDRLANEMLAPDYSVESLVLEIVAQPSFATHVLDARGEELVP